MKHEWQEGEYMDGGCSCGWNAKTARTEIQKSEWFDHVDNEKPPALYNGDDIMGWDAPLSPWFLVCLGIGILLGLLQQFLGK